MKSVNQTTTGGATMATRRSGRASYPARRTALKQKLAANRRTTPLFDAPRFCRHLERAYEMMLDRAAAGAAPQAFDVEAS